MNRENIYFSHDANAMSDPKCMLLIEQLGMEGYGMFWGLVEMLRQQPEYKMSLRLIPALANRFKVSESKLKTVVSGYGLFVIENDEFFFSRSLRERMELMEYKKIQRSIAGKKAISARWSKKKALPSPSNASEKLEDDTNVIRTYNERNTNSYQRKEIELSTTNVVSNSCISYSNKDSSNDKDSLEDKERGNFEKSESSDSSKSKAKAFSPPSISEIESYCRERNNGIDAEWFHDFYQSKNWMVGKSKMKDWKASVRTWERRMKNEKKQQSGSSQYEEL